MIPLSVPCLSVILELPLAIIIGFLSGRSSKLMSAATIDLLSWSSEILKALPEPEPVAAVPVLACNMCDTMHANSEGTCPECGSGSRLQLQGWHGGRIPQAVVRSVCKHLDLTQEVAALMPDAHLRWAITVVHDWAALLQSKSLRLRGHVVSPPLLTPSLLCLADF